VSFIAFRSSRVSINITLLVVSNSSMGYSDVSLMIWMLLFSLIFIGVKIYV